MAAGAQRLHELAVQKEQELQRLREQQQKALEEALKSCQEELGREKERGRELEQDFRYNLSLIEQRDQELARYETAFTELKKVSHHKHGSGPSPQHRLPSGSKCSCSREQ